jgi:hypothetical protein
VVINSPNLEFINSILGPVWKTFSASPTASAANYKVYADSRSGRRFGTTNALRPDVSPIGQIKSEGADHDEKESGEKGSQVEQREALDVAGRTGAEGAGLIEKR